MYRKVKKIATEIDFIIVIFKAFNVLSLKKELKYCLLVLTNKVLLKTNQIVYNLCTGETWCCFEKKEGNIGISHNYLENIGISDIGKNLI